MKATKAEDQFLRALEWTEQSINNLASLQYEMPAKQYREEMNSLYERKREALSKLSTSVRFSPFRYVGGTR